MIPPMGRDAILAEAVAGRFLLVMQGEGNWGIFQIEKTRRGSDVIVVDPYPEFKGKYMCSEASHGLYEYGDGESMSSSDTFVYLHSKTIVAVIHTRPEAESIYQKLTEVDQQFAEATAGARVVYQLGAMMALEQA